MKRASPILIINLLLLVTLVSCRSDSLDVNISDIALQFSVNRFDQELFNVDFDHVDEAITVFYSDYGDFFDAYNVHVINIGPASHRLYSSYLSMFVNDPQNRELYQFTQEKFPDMQQLNSLLSDAFKRYLFHYPDSTAPDVVTYIGGFNHRLFTVGKFIGIGLDQYLGKDTHYYDMLGTPEYMQFNMHPEKIPSDLAQVWGASLFPYNDSVDNVLCRMLYQGMLLYYTDVLFPGMEDALKIGFSEAQLKFCQNNEEQMWTYLVEHELLFSTDQLDIKKLIDEAPTTYFFPTDSPGRAAVWLGWQIVREYARRHPGMSPPEILQLNDYQDLLRKARYNP